MEHLLARATYVPSFHKYHQVVSDGEATVGRHLTRCLMHQLLCIDLQLTVLLFDQIPMPPSNPDIANLLGREGSYKMASAPHVFCLKT